jgi:dephospho-CoA kinase
MRMPAAAAPSPSAAPRPAFVYGLTGGIGAGKSTVAGMFSELGVTTFDADAIGRRLLAGGGPEARAVLQRWPDCVTADGRPDRRAIARRVFGDAAERRWLEDLLHPAIERELQRQLDAAGGRRWPLALLEGAVLIESRTRFALDGMLVVWAPAAVRRLRVQARDGGDPQAIEQRIRAQLPEADKILAAHDLIDNAGERQRTRWQVRRALDHLLQEIGGSA